MCAINGFNFENRELAEKMNKTTSHRGPDGTGIFVGEGISFGHNRLSIIDLSEAASQPMTSQDDNLVIIFNGEIYNFRELKEELKLSYFFKTKSDTEVILAAYQKWGEDCVNRLNGMFAFAIWDKLQKKLFLARDHFGIKPLYYFWDGKKFIFSSEIKAILEHGIERKLNKEALNHYLRVLYTPAPLTMFQGIYKMEPGSIATLKNGVFSVKKYWDPSVEMTKSNSGEIENNIRESVKKAVARQLVSDRPLGVYLSGGMDSSIVLNCIAKERKNIDTFSVGFELSLDEETNKFNRDFNLARQTAAFYGTNHHEVVVSPGEVAGYLEKAVWHLDEPISNATVVPMMKLAEYAKSKGVHVVLGGDGGDELFGGYERYRLSLMASYFRRLPEFLRYIFSYLGKTFQKLDTKEGVDRFSLFMFQKNDILESVVEKDFFDAKLTANFFDAKFFRNKTGESFEKIFMETDLQSWLPDESLVRSDKTSMSSALETRVPLLDIEVAKLALSTPVLSKVNIFGTKIALKRAFKKGLPPHLFGEPKRGWFSPAAKWLRHPDFAKYSISVLSPNYYEPTKHIFKWNEVRKILDMHREKKKYNLTIIWAILIFQIWAKTYNIKI